MPEVILPLLPLQFLLLLKQLALAPRWVFADLPRPELLQLPLDACPLPVLRTKKAMKAVPSPTWSPSR